MNCKAELKPGDVVVVKYKYSPISSWLYGCERGAYYLLMALPKTKKQKRYIGLERDRKVLRIMHATAAQRLLFNEHHEKGKILTITLKKRFSTTPYQIQKVK